VDVVPDLVALVDPAVVAGLLSAAVASLAIALVRAVSALIKVRWSADAWLRLGAAAIAVRQVAVASAGGLLGAELDGESGAADDDVGIGVPGAAEVAALVVGVEVGVVDGSSVEVGAVDGSSAFWQVCSACSSRLRSLSRVRWAVTSAFWSRVTAATRWLVPLECPGAVVVLPVAVMVVDPVDMDAFVADVALVVCAEVAAVAVPVVALLVVLAVWLASSVARVCWSTATAAASEVTCCCSAVVLRVAIVWPAVTLSPTWTLTALTVPAIGKDAVAWLTGLSVPTEVRAWLTVAVVTSARRYFGPELPLVATATPPPTASRVSPAMPPVTIRRRCRRARLDAGCLIRLSGIGASG
jgi:hypothetical protein